MDHYGTPQDKPRSEVQQPQPQQHAAFNIGAEGGEAIRRSLSVGDPRRAIASFQQQNGLKVGGCLEVLELTDLLGVSRVGIYESLLHTLRETMLQKIQELLIEDLEALLDKVFPYIGFEELRPIPVAIMKRHPNIPVRFLKRLRKNKDIYADLPIEIKRQLWEADSELFRQEVFPLLNQYINDPIFSQPVDLLDDSVDEPNRRRENNQVLQSLVHLIGKSLKLYNSMLHFCRTLFVNTSNITFCTLRSDLLMTLHDKGLSEIYKNDPSHYIAWYLDAWIRVGHADIRRIRDIQTYLRTLRKNEPVWGDIAIIIANPVVFNTLVINVFNQLVDIMLRRDGASPKEDEVLRKTTDLLTIGSLAQRMLSEQDFSLVNEDTATILLDDRQYASQLAAARHPKSKRARLAHMQQQQQQQQGSPPTNDLLGWFYPALLAMMKGDTSDADVDANFIAGISENVIARKVALYFILRVFQQYQPAAPASKQRRTPASVGAGSSSPLIASGVVSSPTAASSAAVAATTASSAIPASLAFVCNGLLGAIADNIDSAMWDQERDFVYTLVPHAILVKDQLDSAMRNTIIDRFLIKLASNPDSDLAWFAHEQALHLINNLIIPSSAHRTASASAAATHHPISPVSPSPHSPAAAAVAIMPTTGASSAITEELQQETAANEYGNLILELQQYVLTLVNDGIVDEPAEEAPPQQPQTQQQQQQQTAASPTTTTAAAAATEGEVATTAAAATTATTPPVTKSISRVARQYELLLKRIIGTPAIMNNEALRQGWRFLFDYLEVPFPAPLNAAASASSSSAVVATTTTTTTATTTTTTPPSPPQQHSLFEMLADVASSASPGTTPPRVAAPMTPSGGDREGSEK